MMIYSELFMKFADREYELIKDILPVGKLRDKSFPDNRLFIEAVLYIAKTGCGWRQLPPEYGRWKSVWQRFDRWSKNGIWSKMLDKLKSTYEETVSIDSTSIKVHQEGMRYIKKLENRGNDWKVKGRQYNKNTCNS